MNHVNLRYSPHYGKLTSLALALLCISMATTAEETSTQSESPASLSEVNDSATNQSNSQTNNGLKTLSTLTFEAKAAPPKDSDISAVAKTIVTREEMEKYGDQSVNDALRRAAGFQMPTPGQGPRGAGGASGMRFRGGGAPVFLVNGEPVQGGPRGGMSVVDTITPDMIERIEITKQPSVAQASVASSAVINIILGA